MIFEMTNCNATLSIKPVPTVFIRTPHLPGVHSYSATQFLECAAQGKSIGIAGGYLDDPVIEIKPQEVAGLANWLREMITPLDGEFRTVWVANDPRVPF